MRQFVIGGNWKLQINTLAETKSVLTAIRDAVDQLSVDMLDIFIALPYTSLSTGQDLLHDSPIALAAQNVHYKESGPFTGEISIESLKELGVQYVLVGHSERRLIFGEQNTALNKKVHKVLEHGLIPVFCIGETASQRAAGNHESVLAQQLTEGLAGITEPQLESIILAYEPVWAINNPLLNPDGEIKAATAEEAGATQAYIRSWFAKTYSQEVADHLRIQYGGSMKPANCEDLLSLPDIDGGLIGSASLSAELFLPIIRTAISLQTQ